MKHLGIRKVYYSVDDGIVCEKVSKMISINSSSSRMRIDRRLKNAPSTNSRYFENLLDQYFPDKVCERNLKLFIDYNFSLVLPQFKTYRKKIRGEKYFVICSDKGRIIRKALIY